MEAIQDVDNGFTVIVTKDRNPFLNGFAEVMDKVGAAGMILAFICLMAYFIWRKSYRVAVFSGLALFFALAFTQIIKMIAHRNRPDDAIQVVKETGYSFPSQHTALTVAFVVVCILIFQQTWVKIAGVIFAIIMMWSRTYLGVHYLTDVLVGALVGLGSAYLAWYLVKKYYESTLDWLMAKPKGNAAPNQKPTRKTLMADTSSQSASEAQK